ncbi:tolloid-like protein 2 isoform X2 [Acropora muricata]|uniref:tolloid-like protein 2 isoform X2 n=1 Tax=Acropora muricata TaxID=159855 RepID=UPI0034E4C770
MIFFKQVSILPEILDASSHICGSVENNALNSPGYPANYPDNLLCVYRVNIPQGKELNIHFNYFRLQRGDCGLDYLKITDGSNRVIGTFCDEETGRSVLVNDTVAFLTFKTNEYLSSHGFCLSFSFLPRENATLLPFGTPTTTQSLTSSHRPTATPKPVCVSLCGSVKNNTLRSPRYPANYTADLHCVYRVNIPHGEKLKICFDGFTLEPSRTCEFDSLKITDGCNRVIGKFCGEETGRCVLVNDAVAVLTFETEAKFEKSGFYLSFSFLPRENATLLPCITPRPTPTPSPTSSRQLTASSTPVRVSLCGSAENNTLRSPGYPANYPADLHCVYRVNISHGEKLKICFDNFNLEVSSMCGFDSLKITDGCNRVIGKFCGEETGRCVVVNDTVAVLTFETDASIEDRGFYLSFSFLPRENATLLPCITPRPTTSPSPTSSHRPTATPTPGLDVTPKSPHASIAYNPTPEEPSDAAIKEAVMVIVDGLDVNKWDQRMEDGFKAEVGRAATQYCNAEEAKCLTSSARSRRRRSSVMVFSPNMVHILPGYPKRSPEDPKVAMIALYLSLPPDVSQGTVLSKYILTTLIKRNMPSIGRSINGSIVKVYPLGSPPGEFQNNDNKSDANRTGATVGGIVGGCLFLVVIVALLMFYVKYRRSRVGFDLKQEKWQKPVRGEQSLEKIVELGEDPRAASSNVVESQNPREETREQTRDYPVASTMPLRQELGETSKDDQGIEMQRIKTN